MSDLVLITGGSGHIGSRVIADALEAGYRVRAAVRTQARANMIRSTRAISALGRNDKLDFVIVPDLLADGAYDEAIDGAAYAIHLASPIEQAHKEGDSFQTTFIDPAVKGTLNMLEAAKKAKSVKRVVITSSVVAIMSWQDQISGTKDKIFNEKSRTPNPREPYDDVSEAYTASKIAALNETEVWVKRQAGDISFDVVNIFPGWVLGRNELVTDTADAIRGTNKTVLGPLTGMKLSDTPGMSVHVGDVARAHVAALDKGVTGNQGYVLVSNGIKGTRWEDMFDIVERNFPEAVKAGVLSSSGKIGTIPVQVDESISEKALGFKFRGFEDQVKDLVKDYLDLSTKST